MLTSHPDLAPISTITAVSSVAAVSASISVTVMVVVMSPETLGPLGLVTLGFDTGLPLLHWKDTGNWWGSSGWIRNLILIFMRLSTVLPVIVSSVTILLVTVFLSHFCRLLLRWGSSNGEGCQACQNSDEKGDLHCTSKVPIAG